LWKAQSAAKDAAAREHERAFEVSQVNVTLRQEVTARQQMEESLRDTLGKLERSRAEFHGKLTELQRFQEAIFEREHQLAELEKENQQLKDQLKRQEKDGS
jgi:predicted nuclease with TOPRIM domain